jgi:hypothetical protein
MHWEPFHVRFSGILMLQRATIKVACIRRLSSGSMLQRTTIKEANDRH